MRDFGFELERRIVELELRERVAKGFVLVRFDRIKTGKYLGLHFLETGQGRFGGLGGVRDRIAHARVLQFLDARDHEAHFARGEFGALLALGRKDPTCSTR